MINLNISVASDKEREWAAGILSDSEPWITLGVTYEKCLKNCSDQEYQIYVAHLEKKPAGFVILDLRGMASSPYIKSIAVAPEYRNRKLGAEILKYAENVAHQTSEHMFLCVSSFNSRARHFYEKNGYETVGELRDYIIKGESEIIMHKRL
jgi:[ribosomal protein S18]-alanine N-acetyltransferase